MVTDVIKQPIIVGVGAEFRGDDCFGLDVVDELLATGKFPSARLTKCTDLSRLLYFMAADQGLVIVDAVRDSQRQHGDLIAWEITNGKLPRDRASTSSHSVGLGDALQLAATLGRLPQRVRFIGVVGSSFALGSPMTPELKVKVGEVAALIAAECLSITR
jgi:hydrogenase maturation protease